MERVHRSFSLLTRVSRLTTHCDGLSSVCNVINLVGLALWILTFVYQCFLSFSISQIPHSLFKEQGYDHREALFGVPPYGGSIAQNVYYANSDLCDPNVDTSIGYPKTVDKYDKDIGWQAPYILMVDRGGCTFVKKVCVSLVAMYGCVGFTFYRCYLLFLLPNHMLLLLLLVINNSCTLYRFEMLSALEPPVSSLLTILAFALIANALVTKIKMTTKSAKHRSRSWQTMDLDLTFLSLPF